jgi:ankyrin repeat protein
MKMTLITHYCIMQSRITKKKLLIFYYSCKPLKNHIAYCLYSGANIDKQNKFGETALHICSG